MKTYVEIAKEIIFGLMEKEPNPSMWDLDDGFAEYDTKNGGLVDSNLEITKLGYDVFRELDDMQEALIEEFKQEALCLYCDGSGEGRHDGTKCQHCNHGVVE